MGRLRKAVKAQRARRQKERSVDVMKERIKAALRRTLCLNHYFQLDGRKFQEELSEVGGIMDDSPEWAKEVVFPFFPEAPGVISQELLQSFTRWLKSDYGEAFRHEGLRWCEFIRTKFLKCTTCRGGEPILLEDDEEVPLLKSPGSKMVLGESSVKKAASVDYSRKPTEADAWRLFEMIRCAMAEEKGGTSDDADPKDPMQLDPDVQILTGTVKK